MNSHTFRRIALAQGCLPDAPATPPPAATDPAHDAPPPARDRRADDARNHATRAAQPAEA